MFTPTDMKENFEKLGQETLEILNGFNNIQLTTDFEDQQVKESLKAIKQEIGSGIKKISKTLDYLLKNAEWKTINIGFFGETNAGKSTLIEALTKGDGSTIGDGRKDFTKRLSQIPYEGAQFLDMPGIEGDEVKVKEEIRRALEKCHVIFYVYRGDKQPEEPTMRKVRGYLKGYAKVYSIMNISGPPSTYKYVPQLITEREMIVEKNSIQAFERALAGHYRSNTMLQGYLSFLAMGNPDREDLLKDQHKARSIFSNNENILEFSRLKSIEELLSQIINQGVKEIIVSNYYKLMRDMEFTLGMILYEKKAFDEVVKQFREILYLVLNDIETLFEKNISKVKRTVETFFISLEQKLIKTVSVINYITSFHREICNQLHHFIPPIHLTHQCHKVV